MESLKRSIRFQFAESKKFIINFWIVIIIVDIAFYLMNNLSSLNTSIGFSIGLSEGINSISVTGVNLMAILISLIVYNYSSNYESFPLAVSLSMTRKDYFLSFLVDNVLIAFVFAIIQGVLLKIDPMFVKLIGRNPLYDFGYFNTSTDNIFYIIFILFIMFLGFSCFWNIVASINYKFGYKIWLIFWGANILISFIKVDFLYFIIKPIWEIIDPRLGVSQILTILAIVTVLYGFNYFIVIRTDVKKKLA